MTSFIQQIFTLLTNPPANLIYHLGLSLSILAALLTARFFSQTQPSSQARRMVFGLTVLLAAQLVLFTTSGLAWQGLADPQIVLPPLDRAVTVLSLLWIVWLWVYPDRVPAVEAVLVFLNIVTVIALAFSLTFWSDQSQSVPFSATAYGFAWELFGLVIVLLGILALLLRRPAGWGYGLAMAAVILAGFLVQLFANLSPNDFPGAVRLALLTAYPLLLVLPQRLVVFSETGTQLRPTAAQIYPPHPVTRERRRYSTDAKTLQAFIQLASAESVPELAEAATRLIGHAMLADLTFIVSTPDSSGWISLESGYDLIREEPVPGARVSATNVPGIADALLNGRSLVLVSQEPPSKELRVIGDSIGLTRPGNLLLVPVVQESEGTPSEPAGAVLLISPYANRIWSEDDLIFLRPVTHSLVRILQGNVQYASVQKEFDQLNLDLETARLQNEQVRKSYQELQERFEILRSEDQNKVTQAQNLASLVAVQQEYQQTIEHLQSENEKLQEAVQLGGARSFDLPAEDGNAALEAELAQLSGQVNQLRAALSEANLKLLELEKSGPASSIPVEQADSIATVAQELRQPLSSITGYTDLLIGESVGILGALQHKFLERIKSSTERMRGQVDDLIHTLAIDSGSMHFSPELVDLGTVIDQAIQETSTQVREKNITLRVDLPEELPQLTADRDALQQMMIHLLHNANSASPEEGTVSLKVRIQSEKDQQDFVLIQVTDSGGGIPTEELSRVFSRLYRSENLLIQGLGDSGVGLSVARALVEAHSGRIWVDSQPGESSTFSVVLPVQSSRSPVEG